MNQLKRATLKENIMKKKAQKIMVFLASKYDSVVFSGTPQLGMPFRN